MILETHGYGEEQIAYQKVSTLSKGHKSQQSIGFPRTFRTRAVGLSQHPISAT
jgi:hypothetical protein